MPPLGKTSRYNYCLGMQSKSGRWYLSNKVPYRYNSKLTDIKKYIAKAGDTWWSLAELFYGTDGWKYWKQLMDFQPIPAADPTLSIEAGYEVVYPTLSDMLQVLMAKNGA